MKRLGLVVVAALVVVVAIPVVARAQEATLIGTVNDSTGGALPGVTVRAVHTATGNSFEAVTDERGGYRIPARVGPYRVTAELPGFLPATQTVTLLVGQEAVVNLQMAVSGVQESVTVTGEAPLLDVTASSLGGNIDPRQLQELPVQGRNWLDLVMLAPGARVNAVSAGTPTDAGNEGGARSYSSRAGGDFQINVDGQPITQLSTGAVTSSKGQPRLSRDAMAEFEFLSSRFDATQGRSSGMQVNAVTKSGTNVLSGSFAGYFRDDRFIAADHVAGRVLPYKDRQVSGTVGGPIVRDKIHFFANSEYEHEPKTFIYTTPFAYFNTETNDVHTENIAGGRVDAQFSPQLRLAVRGNYWRLNTPASGGTPTGRMGEKGGAEQVQGTLTQVMGARGVNEIKAGYAKSIIDPYFHVKNPLNPYFQYGGPSILLQGVTAGVSDIWPNRQEQTVYNVRDDFTLTFAKGGRHTVKMGAEYLYMHFYDYRCTRCGGELRADRGPLPAPIEQIFPDLFDISTWKLDLLAPVADRWRQAFAAEFVPFTTHRHTTAYWVQDDWTVTPRLTVNLGLRYDLELNPFTKEVEMLPFDPGTRPPDDLNNVGPRLGFSFSANDRTVIRGGYGLYFATVATGIRAKFYGENVIVLATTRDGRPDFPSNPYNGAPPTYEQLVASQCTVALRPGCTRRDVATAGAVYYPDFKMPYAHQVSIGVQRQLGTTLGVQADYVYTGNRDRQNDLPLNIRYNPVTGANYPFSDISRRPFPEWGYLSMTVNGSRANYHALQTALTKRFSNRWQGSGTYTLSWAKDARTRPLEWNGTRFVEVPFPTAPDLGGEYTLSGRDQRHRAVLNGIFDAPYQIQISGLYHFGSGERWYTDWSTDLRQLGDLRPNENRLRPDGTIVPRANFVAESIHRVDLRIQRRFSLGGRAGIEPILELFNMFNHANYGEYVTSEIASNYGEPQQSDNPVAYGPRTLQLGFRLSF
jgi:hypothetical protein